MGGEKACCTHEPIFQLYFPVFIMGQNVKFGFLYFEIAISTSPCSEIARQAQHEQSPSLVQESYGRLSLQKAQSLFAEIR